MPNFVYILWSSTGLRFYIGITGDVRMRLAQHNDGESKWTKRYAGTWQVVWHRECGTLGIARQLENQLKAQKKGSGFWAMTGLNPEHYWSSGS
jgi:predicted GIY-YIG superfamily endonuclease